jgi:glutathionyl-hydroquinone reductase
MDQQQLFNVLFALVGVLGGWWMKAMWEAIKSLEQADKQLNTSVNNLHVLVAGGYVKTEQFDSMSKAIFAKLDRIEDKLDGKADKP